MNALVFGGDAKAVAEKLEALNEIHAGQTVEDVAEFFSLMNEEQKAKYIELIVELHRKNKRQEIKNG